MSATICSVDGCDGKHKAKGFCSKHYHRYLKYGDPHKIIKPNRVKHLECCVDGCKNNVSAKNMCKNHYMKTFLHGDPLYSHPKMHGMSKSPEYRSWKAMKNRCYRKSHRSYYRYGGRGITVCDRWRNSFVSFYEDMGQRPFPKAQLDRINNDLGYSSENCEWATNQENSRHTSRTKLDVDKAREIRMLSSEGRSRASIAREFGVDPSVISNIALNKAWKEN